MPGALDMHPAQGDPVRVLIGRSIHLCQCHPWLSKISVVASSFRSTEDHEIYKVVADMHADVLAQAGTTLLQETQDATHPFLSKPLSRWKRNRSLRKAEAQLRRAATINEKNHAAFHNWALCYIQLAETTWPWNRARLLRSGIEHLKQVIGMSQTTLIPLNHLGLAFMYLGKTEEDKMHFEEARKSYMKAESMHPGLAAYNLACLSALVGDAKGCRDWLDTAQRTGTLPSRPILAADGAKPFGIYRGLRLC
jgi:hypothetical protein